MPPTTRRTGVTGLNDVIRALEALPRNEQREARAGAVRVSRDLARAIRTAGRASDRQSARASRTVRTATQGFTPSVIAGPHPLLFGSNFGAFGRYGWYGKPRYGDSPARQFRPHHVDYWFFSTQEREQPRLEAEMRRIADAIIGDWGA